MNEIIFSYEKKDIEYFQLLLTITDLLPIDELNSFEKLLRKAEENNKKVEINDSGLLENWDSLEMKNIRIQN